MLKYSVFSCSHFFLSFLPMLKPSDEVNVIVDPVMTPVIVLNLLSSTEKVVSYEYSFQLSLESF